MNKILAKTIGKWKIWAIVAAVVLLAGVIVSAIFGFNLSSTVDDTKTVTVRVESYLSEPQAAKVENICIAEFNKVGAYTDYEVEASIANGKVKEYVYTFDANTSRATLETAQGKIKAAFESEESLKGLFLYVTVNENATIGILAKGFVWRAALAFAVATVALFIYSAIRHKVAQGLLVTGVTVLGTALAVVLVGLVRIPVTTTIVYAFAFAFIYSAFGALTFAASVKSGLKDPENAEKSVEEIVVSSVAVKETVIFAGALLLALILVGAIAITAVSWLAVAAIIGLVAGLYTTLIFLPSVYLPVKKCADKRAEKRARYDYKKGAKKEKSEEQA